MIQKHSKVKMIVRLICINACVNTFIANISNLIYKGSFNQSSVR